MKGQWSTHLFYRQGKSNKNTTKVNIFVIMLGGKRMYGYVVQLLRSLCSEGWGWWVKHRTFLTQTMFSDLNPDLSKLWPSFSNSVVLHLGERSNFNLVCSVLANYLFCYLDMRMCCVVSCVVGFPWLRNSYTDSNHFFFLKKKEN